MTTKRPIILPLWPTVGWLYAWKPLETSSFSQQPMSAAASTVQINPATQAQELPSNSGATANLLQGTSITLTKIVSTSNVSDAALAVAPQPGVSSGAVILTENLLAAAVEEGEIFTTTTNQIKPLLPPPCPAVPPQTPPMQSDTAPAVHQLEQPLGLPKTFSLAAAGRPRKRKPVNPSSCIYACDNCTKAFTTKFNLQRHINMHCLKSIEMGVPLQGPPSASQPSRRTREKREAAAAQASADSEHRNAEDSKSNVKMAKKTAAGLNTQKSVVPTTPSQTSNPSTIQISRVQAAPAPPNQTAVQPTSVSVSNSGLLTVTKTPSTASVTQPQTLSFAEAARTGGLMNSRTLSLWPIRLHPSSTTTSAMSGPVTLQSVGGTQAAVAPDQMTVQVIRTVSTPAGPQQQIIRMPVSAAAAAMTAPTSAVTPEVNRDGTGILTVDTSAISTCSPASQPFQLHHPVSLEGATPPVSTAPTASTAGSIRLPQTPMPLEQVWSQTQYCFMFALTELTVFLNQDNREFSLPSYRFYQTARKS